MNADYAVLGAGLMGRLLALSLARVGHGVALYERGGPDAASSAAHVAAAMLAPLAEAVDAEPLIVDLGRDSLTRWPGLLAGLPRPVFFQQNGTVIVWHSQDRDQAAQFSRRLHRLDESLPPEQQARALDGAELAELEPGLSQRFPRGLYLPGEGPRSRTGGPCAACAARSFACTRRKST